MCLYGLIILGKKTAQTKGQLAHEQFGSVGLAQETGRSPEADLHGDDLG